MALQTIPRWSAATPTFATASNPSACIKRKNKTFCPQFSQQSFASNPQMIKQNANNIRPLLILWEQIRHHQHRHIFPEKKGRKNRAQIIRHYKLGIHC